MITEIDNGVFQISININGEWWVDKQIVKWMYGLKRNTQSAYNSRQTYARALDIFLHYYIYSPQLKEQSLYDYLLIFRENLLKGFTLTTTRYISTERLSFKSKYIVFRIKGLSIRSVNTYMTGIQWYLQFLKDEKVDTVDSLFHDDIDWKQLHKRSLQSRGGGYGLMMGPLLAQLLGPKKKLIKNLNLGRTTSKINSYFPPELFLDLLKLSNPREQAIYLLCACAGTRIGQALSLTRDDYNYDTTQVYIVDPLSDETGPSGTQKRRILLSSKYKINMEKTPYKYLACKYPIPLQYTELLWINLDFKRQFFQALSMTNKGNPDINEHPFVFNTNSGKILTPNECYRTFRRKVDKLSEQIRAEWLSRRDNISLTEKHIIDSEYQYLLEQLKKVGGLHSLRHMYAIMWADLSAIEGNDIDDLMALTAFGLGHSKTSSVLQYFTLRAKTREIITNRVMKTAQSNSTYIHENIKNLKKYRSGGLYATTRN